ncbi:MAG: hypothetical protein J2P53_18790 [Bradyrhizobiaceae bacterium]|nr:hypothetical protein [Bradyrhizobiaceae bacterium]
MKSLTISLALGTVALAGTTTARAQVIEVPVPAIVETEGIPRLPNYFRDCWEPLPAHCVRPAGLLWFGDAATLAHEHRAPGPRRGPGYR